MQQAHGTHIFIVVWLSTDPTTKTLLNKVLAKESGLAASAMLQIKKAHRLNVAILFYSILFNSTLPYSIPFYSGLNTMYILNEDYNIEHCISYLAHCFLYAGLALTF